MSYLIKQNHINWVSEQTIPEMMTLKLMETHMEAVGVDNASIHEEQRGILAEVQLSHEDNHDQLQHVLIFRGVDINALIFRGDDIKG